MNGNSSKQILLSVLGIAVLVVAVVGVSFAFFTYSRQGTTNNVITTGSIYFNYSEGTAIKLSNQLPVGDTEGASLTAATGDNATLTFSVVGWDSSGVGIDYTIKAYQGTVPDGKQEVNRLRDSEIKLLLTTSASGTGYTNNYSTSTGTVVGTDGSLASGVTLATGRITASSSAAQQTDTYTLRMWITNTVVNIGTATDATTHTYSNSDFQNKFYSLRVDVNANSAS